MEGPCPVGLSHSVTAAFGGNYVFYQNLVFYQTGCRTNEGESRRILKRVMTVIQNNGEKPECWKASLILI